MVVVYKQSDYLRQAISFFNVTSPLEIPFLTTHLGEVSSLGWKAIDSKTSIFIPKNWALHESSSFTVYSDLTMINLDKEELIVFTDLGSLPITVPSKYDLNPGTVYESEGVWIGYGFSSMSDFLTCKTRVKNFESIEFIQFSVDGLAECILLSSGSSKESLGDIYTYSGNVKIDEHSEVSGNSRIYGPSIILASSIIDSTVYPGSVVINSKLVDSSVEQSYIDDTLLASAVLDKVVSYKSSVSHLGIKNSKLPRFTELNGRNETKRLGQI